MTHVRRPALVALALAVLLPGCHGSGQTSDSGSQGSTGAASSGGVTDGESSGGATMSGGTGTGSGSSGASDPTTGGMGGQCNLFLQDCPEGQKCSAYSEDGSIFPNGTRCVPVSPNSVGPGEECTVEGKFGDGIDNCAKGSLCLDIENDGMATCVAYCTGDMDNPKCPLAESQKCSFLFEPTVPLCFTACDPLIQNCGSGEACVPNEAALGAPFFVCMPRVYPQIPGAYGDPCIALSGCDPGNLCIFGENLPNCNQTYCCSVWCDLTAMDPCSQFDPTLKCVPWFEPGQETPGFENVGVCGIMQ